MFYKLLAYSCSLPEYMTSVKGKGKVQLNMIFRIKVVPLKLGKLKVLLPCHLQKF